jgi:RNA polymerase I-specific transcription initiation factor RRN3
MKLIALVPSAQLELFANLEKCFPHKRFDSNIQVEFVSQLLVICEYLTSQQSSIFELIICKSLEMDVEIVIEETGDCRIDEKEEQDIYDAPGEFELFKLDVVDGDDDDANQTDHPTMSEPNIDTNASHQQSINGQRIPQEVSEMAEKLDAILMIFIQYIDYQFAKENNLEQQDRLFKYLLVIFEEKILFTHKSKFVQFVLFYISAKDVKYTHAFIDR